MSKLLHQNCLTSTLVILVLFGTQMLLAQQSNTPTYFRHPNPTRILENIETRQCSPNPNRIDRSLDDSDATYNVCINPNNSTFVLKFDLDDQSKVAVELNVDLFQDVIAVIEVVTTKWDKISITVDTDYDKESIRNFETKFIIGSKNQLVITLKNPYSSEAKVSVTVGPSDYDDDSLAPWIIPVVVTAGILLVIVATSITYTWLRKRRERRQLQWIYSGDFYGGTQPTQAAQEDKDAFNLERDLNKVFPEAKNEKFKSSFPQKTCTICLEDFQGDQLCRQLHCQHIFHTECIKLWLESQASKKLKVFCPNCHKEIVKVEKKSKA